MTIAPIDLRNALTGGSTVIGCYLLETSDGPGLLDCGPAVCVDALKRGLAERGLELTDLRHLLLTHIHLDHAGAAGVLVREHPELQVHVSEVGAPHLLDPSRLERSARRLWGDAFDELWGELVPVPEENLQIAGDRVVGFECFPSRGHANHHVCYVGGDGTLYTGDAAGVRIQPASFVLPPTVPPEFDRDAWFASLAEIERRAPERLALIHFGVATDVARHLDELRARLERWTELVAGGATEEEFVAAGLRELEEAGIDDLGPWGGAPFLAMNYHGLARWAAQQREAEA